MGDGAPELALPVAEGWSLRSLRPADLAGLQALLDRCADYFLTAEGRPPRPTEAQDLCTTLPAGTSADDKHLLGVFCGELRGVVDVIRDWPRPRTWLLGLLLLDPRDRGRGVGAAVVAALDRWAASAGADRLRVAVVEANPRALCFWRSLGFSAVPALGPAATALERQLGGPAAERSTG
jgi:GNAT superfamily N-acetyltransferase